MSETAEAGGCLFSRLEVLRITTAKKFSIVLSSYRSVHGPAGGDVAMLSGLWGRAYNSSSFKLTMAAQNTTLDTCALHSASESNPV